MGMNNIGDAAIYYTPKGKLHADWWVLCRIDIYDTVTKRLATHTAEELLWDYNPDLPGIEGEPQWSDYMWVEGNYACDCNRHLFWGRALGLKEFEANATCGHSRFIVTSIVRLDTGEKVYGELIHDKTLG